MDTERATGCAAAVIGLCVIVLLLWLAVAMMVGAVP